ncbi:long-chain-fatty-acid-- ligase 5 [Brachionus plicatilis]|uniref:long-chain-fatty-acid--CoA ligase n=1 Tax=Brachionus plicatilis TaxID=10195 RepID=A0A3M7SHD8_BRAPC|nr:long-chain-fatty-acid-- ligase 5 [Brachionus plicatilis]
MYPFYHNQNQNWPNAQFTCFSAYSQPFNQENYAHNNFYFAPQPFSFNGTFFADQNSYVSQSNRQPMPKSTESLIDYANFDYKRQARKVCDGKGFSYISNLNSANHLIPYHDEKTRTIFDIFRQAYKSSGGRNFLGWKPSQQQPFKWMTYSDANAQIKQIGSSLIKLGLKHGAFVGIFAKNRPEWVLTDLACVSYSFTSIPMYETFGPDAIPFILKQTEMKIVFCEDSAKAGLLLKSNSKELKFIIVYESKIDPDVKELAKRTNVTILNFNYLRTIGKANLVDSQPPQPQDIYTICYTSGTTGLPKGAILTHANMVSSLNAASILFKKEVKLNHGEEVYLSYLPLAHMMERIAQTYIIWIAGSIGFFKGDIAELPNYLQEVRPTFFLTVPRLLNKFKSQIELMSKTLPSDKQMMFKRAYVQKKVEMEKGVFNFNSPVDAAFGQIRNLFGGRVKLMITGSAPISPKVFEFFRIVLGCHVIEGYGATETSGGVSIQVPGDATFGHVGSPLVNCRVKLADVPAMGLIADRDNKGEVLVKGSNIFKGYYKDAAKTREALDKDGWYHTGDIGVINENGCLKIVDRVKNFFKLQQGEYIAPEKIEAVYLTCDLIAQIFVHGNSLKSSLVGIVVPDEAAVLAWAKHKGLELNLKTLSASPMLKSDILNCMETMAKAKGLSGFEKVKDIFVYPEGFSIQNGLLTPTFKSKRAELKQFFANEINQMYKNLD